MRSASPEMQRCENLFAGNGTDMSLFERQLEILTRQLQDQRHSHQPQQSCAVDNKTIESYAMPQFLCLINDNSMNADQYIENILPEFGDCRMAGTEFAGDTMRVAPSELAISGYLYRDHSFSLNSTCTKGREIAVAEETGGGSNSTENMASMFGERNLKKRKAEFDVAKSTYKEIGEESEAAANINMETGSTDNSKDDSKVSDVQKPDYIHVRARRGQATDRHSLAERARREKINKKMKYLQDLVPGCSKISGKAGMLDEIINYVQSLQRQVEFLSMKLASLNPRLDFNIDSFFMKEQAQAISTWETDLHTLGNAEFQ